MFSLGQMAYDARDYPEAGRWFDRAYRKGHARSGGWLAKVIWRTASTERDRGSAIELLQRVASENVLDAKRLMKRYETCRRAKDQRGRA
jgi:TPR repeat protein